MKKFALMLGGAVTGLLNGLLGAGGGMVVVPILNKRVEQRKAHSTSVSIILPICVVSAWSYLNSGTVTFSDVTPYLWWGVLGAAVGSWLLPRINETLLKKVFALLMIWAGIRLLMR